MQSNWSSMQKVSTGSKAKTYIIDVRSLKFHGDVEAQCVGQFTKHESGVLCVRRSALALLLPTQPRVPTFLQ